MSEPVMLPSIEVMGVKLCEQMWAMEQRTLKNVNNNLNTNIHSFLETSGGQSSNIYLM